LLFICALVANVIWSIHTFNYEISNFLIPLTEFFYFLIFLILFKLLLGKDISLILDRHFYKMLYILMSLSIFISLLNIYLLVEGKNINTLELLFPFGSLLKYINIIGPLFGAFYWEKLNRTQKTILVISTFLFILTMIFGGRRSLILFLMFFFTFFCWRVLLWKKILTILALGLLYSSVHSYHLIFKEFTYYQAHMNITSDLEERLNKVIVTSQSVEPFINPAVKRLLHQYMLIEPAFKKLDNQEGVGFKPLLTAIYAPIPSQFLDNKPWPGSLDGNWETAFGYVVNKLAFNAGWNMSEYPISLEFFWYGSYLIVFTSITFSS